MSLVLTDYAHFLALAGLAAALAVELALFRPRTDGTTARRLARIDAVYGLMAVLALGTGLLKVFGGDKPATYYAANPLFHVKMTLFVIVLLMSVYPTLRFLARRKAADGDAVEYPARLGTFLKLELLLLAAIPLLAVLMGRGYGYGG